MAMPRVTTQNTTGTTIILTSPMNQSLSGVTALPTSGSRTPTAMPRTAPRMTWNQSWRIRDPNFVAVVDVGSWRCDVDMTGTPWVR